MRLLAARILAARFVLTWLVLPGFGLADLMVSGGSRRVIPGPAAPGRRRRRGRRLPGLVSLTHPTYDAALGTPWSALAVAWGVAVALLSAVPRSEQSELRGEVVEAQRAL